MSTRSFEEANFSSTALAKYLDINNDAEFLAALAESAFYFLNRNDCQIAENTIKLNVFADSTLFKATKSFKLGEAFSNSLQFGFEYIFALDHFKQILYNKLNIVHIDDDIDPTASPAEVRKIFTDALEIVSISTLHEIDAQIF